MAEKDLILAIDNGTQSLKALVFDPAGNLLDSERVIFEPYFSDQPGWAEQDPEVFWQALCQACQAIWARGAVAKSRIAGATLTTQRGTVVNVDREGRPLRPAILWLDQRRTYGLPPVGGMWGFLIKLIRMSDVVGYLQAEAELNWIRTNQPQIWDSSHKFLLLSGFLTHRLTGEFVDSVGCQVGYLPFDYKKLDWAADSDWRWQALPMDKSLLPDLVKPGHELGGISDAAAGATGIPAGTPLFAAAADKACEVIGSGALEPSIGCLSYGTTATINVTSPKYVEAPLPAFPSAVPGQYCVEIQIYRGYWMVSWFKEQFGFKEVEEAKSLGVEPEVLFDRLLDETPPGAMGLTLQPYWSPGLKDPGPEAKGAIIGFGDVHTRAHVYRSILEGLAYGLREGKEKIEKKTKTPISNLMVSGGGSQSSRALQLTADIFGMPTARPHLYETSGLGAAICAAVGLKQHKDFETAIKSMTRAGESCEPNPEAHKIYNELYHDVYKKMYPALKPFYERIREITGYPK